MGHDYAGEGRTHIGQPPRATASGLPAPAG